MKSLKRRLKDELYKWLYVLPTLILIIVIFIIPIFYNIWLSFHVKLIGEAPRFSGLENYYKLLSSKILYVSLINTFIYSFTAVFFKTLIGLAVALLLNKEFRGRGFFRGLSILPWAFPSFVCAVLFWFNYAGRGTFNQILMFLGFQPIHWLGYDMAMPSVILLNIWHGWPFFFMGILAGLQAVPVELYEAAEVDGASSFDKFINITLPMVKPVIFTVVLLSLMWTMGEFTQIYMTTAGGPIDRTLTVPMAAYKIAFMSEANLPLAAAYTVIVLPIYLLLIFLVLKQVEGV